MKACLPAEPGLPQATGSYSPISVWTLRWKLPALQDYEEPSKGRGKRLETKAKAVAEDRLSDRVLADYISGKWARGCDGRRDRMANRCFTFQATHSII